MLRIVLDCRPSGRDPWIDLERVRGRLVSEGRGLLCDRQMASDPWLRALMEEAGIVRAAAEIRTSQDTVLREGEWWLEGLFDPESDSPIPAHRVEIRVFERVVTGSVDRVEVPSRVATLDRPRTYARIQDFLRDLDGLFPPPEGSGSGAGTGSGAGSGVGTGTSGD